MLLEFWILHQVLILNLIHLVQMHRYIYFDQYFYLCLKKNNVDKINKINGFIMPQLFFEIKVRRFHIVNY